MSEENWKEMLGQVVKGDLDEMGAHFEEAWDQGDIYVTARTNMEMLFYTKEVTDPAMALSIEPFLHMLRRARTRLQWLSGRDSVGDQEQSKSATAEIILDDQEIAHAKGQSYLLVDIAKLIVRDFDIIDAEVVGHNYNIGKVMPRIVENVDRVRICLMIMEAQHMAKK